MPIPFLPEHVFARPAMLLLLLALPLLLLLRGRVGRSPAVVFASLPFLKSSAKPVDSRFGGLPVSALATLLALACGILALAQPQKQNSKEQFTASGVEIYLAIDVSNSMRIADFQLEGRQINRLTAAKYVISEFVEARPNDRIGLVIFAGQPSALGPLTLDHEWLQGTIEQDIHFKHPITQGTMIGTAISACGYRLSKREADQKAKSQVIVMLTDGVQTGQGLTPKDAADNVATLGIKVYPIAIGTPGRHRIPGTNSILEQSFDFETLQEVASITGGNAYMANNTETLKKVFAEIDELEKTDIDSRNTIETNELYQWCLAAGLICLLLGLAFEHSILRFAP